MTATVSHAFGQERMAKLAAAVYQTVVIELMLVLTAGPGLAVLVLLDHDAANLPLAAACAIPAGPALSAAVYALWHRDTDLTDLHPAREFLRGYRANAWSAMRVWLPWLAGMTVVTLSLTHLRLASIPRWWAWLLVLVAVAGTLWMLDALVITSLFAFRGVDVARLAAYFLFRTPRVTLAHVCLVVVVVGVTMFATEGGLLLLGSVLTLLVLIIARPMIDRVHQEFVA